MAKPSICTLTSTDGWRRRSADGGFVPRPDLPRRRSTMISSRSCVLTIVRSAARSSADRTGVPERVHRRRGGEGSEIDPPFSAPARPSGSQELEQECLTDPSVAMGLTSGGDGKIRGGGGLE